MWPWLVLVAVADPGDVRSQRDHWLDRAPRLARKACRGEPEPCRADVEHALRVGLTSPDAEEALMSLDGRPGLDDVLGFARHGDTLALLYALDEACLERQARQLVEEASRLASELCRPFDDATCQARTEQLVRDVAESDWRDVDPLHNEIDAIEALGGPRVAEPVARLRARLEGVCAVR